MLLGFVVVVTQKHSTYGERHFRMGLVISALADTLLLADNFLIKSQSIFNEWGPKDEVESPMG
jgi:hypothetical protein